VDSPTVVADLDQPPEPQDQHADDSLRIPPGRRESSASPDGSLRTPLETSVPAEIVRDAAAIVDTVLTEDARALLEFERQWWRQGGAKEQAIRDTFGMTPTRYYQSLNSVLDLPAAVQYDPALVHRLQRLRSTATRGRRLA
jgi:hypothetical protein